MNLMDARDSVMSAALRLASVEWNNGRATAGASMDLDYSQDLFESALAHYASMRQAAASLPEDSPKIVVLCGSTRFTDAFRQANLSLTLGGSIVLTIGCDMHSDAYVFAGYTPVELAKVKAGLDELHKRKIDLADEVLVLNVNGYIGESTRSEITYAKEIGRPIRYLEEVEELTRVEADAAEDVTGR